jgi:hypothetical protein
VTNGNTEKSIDAHSNTISIRMDTVVGHNVITKEKQQEMQLEMMAR